MKGDVSDALATWLQTWPWTWFFTVTYRNPAHYPRVAINRIKAIRMDWLGCESCNRYCSVGGAKGWRAFVAAEPFSAGDYHAHGLIAHPCVHPGESSALFWEMHRRFGRSRVETARDTAAVATYCAKYITKNVADWDLLGDWPRHRPGLTPVI